MSTQSVQFLHSIDAKFKLPKFIIYCLVQIFWDNCYKPRILKDFLSLRKRKYNGPQMLEHFPVFDFWISYVMYYVEPSPPPPHPQFIESWG